MNNCKNINKSIKRLESIFRLQKGYIALSMILVISAVVIGVAATVSLLAIGEAQSGFAQFKGEDTWSFVDGCAEDALQKIHDNAGYGGGNIDRPEGRCTVDTSGSTPPNTWNLVVSTNDTKYKRSIRIQATRGSTITITSWQEI